MGLQSKVETIKEREAGIEARLSRLEKLLQEFGTRFASIDNILRSSSRIDTHVAEMAQKLDKKSSEDEERIRNIELQLNNRIAAFISELSSFENWFKNKDAKHIEDAQKMHERLDQLTKDTKERLNSFVEETQKVHAAAEAQELLRQRLEAKMDQVLESVAKNQRRLQNEMKKHRTVVSPLRPQGEDSKLMKLSSSISRQLAARIGRIETSTSGLATKEELKRLKADISDLSEKTGSSMRKIAGLRTAMAKTGTGTGTEKRLAASTNALQMELNRNLGLLGAKLQKLKKKEEGIMTNLGRAHLKITSGNESVRSLGKSLQSTRQQLLKMKETVVPGRLKVIMDLKAGLGRTNKHISTMEKRELELSKRLDALKGLRKELHMVKQELASSKHPLKDELSRASRRISGIASEEASLRSQLARYADSEQRRDKSERLRDSAEVERKRDFEDLKRDISTRLKKLKPFEVTMKAQEQLESQMNSILEMVRINTTVTQRDVKALRDNLVKVKRLQAESRRAWEKINELSRHVTAISKRPSGPLPRKEKLASKKELDSLNIKVTKMSRIIKEMEKVL
jgi:septal ring factor EnvC (AmiA/AmiB activator)